jgi:hypothetical protein
MFGWFGGGTNATKQADNSLKEGNIISGAFNFIATPFTYAAEKLGNGFRTAAEAGTKLFLLGGAAGGIKALADGERGTDIIPMMLGGSVIAGIGGGVAVGLGSTALDVGTDAFGLLPVGKNVSAGESLSPAPTPVAAQAQQNAKA